MLCFSFKKKRKNVGEDVTAASFFLKLVNNALMVLANEHGHVQGHVQKINYKIKTDAILMSIISNELKFNMELNGKGSHTTI
jgi:hypothetical protein